MAIDTAAKRRAVAGLSFWVHGPGVTPDAAKGVAWRQQVGWGYSGIAPDPPVPGQLVNSGLWWLTMIPPFYNNAIVVVTSDSATANWANPFSAVYVGGAGTVAIVLTNGAAVAFTAVAGEIIPVRGLRVNSTGTSATLMVALFQQ